MLLELRIFRNQRFWDLEIIAAVATNGSIIADIFGTKRAAHCIGLVGLLLRHLEIESQKTGAPIFVLDFCADCMRTRRYLGFGHIDPDWFSEVLDAVG